MISDYALPVSLGALLCIVSDTNVRLILTGALAGSCSVIIAKYFNDLEKARQQEMCPVNTEEDEVNEVEEDDGAAAEVEEIDNHEMVEEDDGAAADVEDNDHDDDAAAAADAAADANADTNADADDEGDTPALEPAAEEL